jgi:hypothetical protein
MCKQCTAPEEWRAVVGYEGWYEVSSYGHVRRVRPGTSAKVGHILKPTPQWHGYLLIDLYRNGIKTKVTVHQIVASAFLGPRPSGLEVNHRDADKANNHAINLEYVTRRENLDHADRLGLTRRGAQNGKAKLTDDDIRVIRSAPVKHGVQSAMARSYGVSHSVIWNVINRKTWRHLP